MTTAPTQSCVSSMAILNPATSAYFHLRIPVRSTCTDIDRQSRWRHVSPSPTTSLTSHHIPPLKTSHPTTYSPTTPGPPRLENGLHPLHPRAPWLRQQHPPLIQHLHHPTNLQQTCHRRVHPRSPPQSPRPNLQDPPNPLDRPRPRRPHRPPPPNLPLATREPQIRSLHRHRPDARAMEGVRPPGC
jgi:hypothetical protein